MRVNYSARRAFVNGGVSALQVVVISGVLLVSYRLAVQSVGQHDFGLYSLYFAFGTLTQLGSLGFGVGAARHVAVAWGQGRQHDLRPLVLLSVGVTLLGAALMAVIIYLGLHVYALASLSPHDRRLAAQLAPVILAAACLAPVSTTAQGLMDGTSRSYARAAVVMSSSLVYLAVVIVGLPSHGVVALAYGTLAQQACVVVALLTYISYLSRGLSSGMRTPSNVGEVARYNLKMHVLTLPTLAYEPLAKALLDMFAGLSAIAYYEIANRLLQQVSALVHAANQAIVPVVAVRASAEGFQPAQAFRKSFQAIFPLTILGFGGALVVLPLLSSFVFGETSATVVWFGVLLSVGWIANCLCGPAYFVGVTLDDFRVNIAANYTSLAVIAVAGAGLGWWFGGYGLAAGVALALVIASSMVNVHYIHTSGLKIRDLLPAEQVVFAVAAGAVVLLSLLISLSVDGRGLLLTVVGGLAALGLVGAIDLMRHPIVKELRTRTEHVS
ncbi:hypothetical protein GCM10023350_38050 [Nocardioides endophyticus]|uniref:Membrane protein involved in the export of O-antigen and teichoic acid n=1 Tax=Nocardioides endophyticus TaxID=1353775 RepID=A0ABP8Z824_9ACTN